MVPLRIGNLAFGEEADSSGIRERVRFVKVDCNESAPTTRGVERVGYSFRGTKEEQMVDRHPRTVGGGRMESEPEKVESRIDAII